MNKRVSVVLGLLAAACLWLAGSRHADLVDMRRNRRLNADEPLENAPPLMVFSTVVLGGFRGLIADLLWLRVSALQDQGRHFEIVQLADWITKLEPRDTEVWAFHAWNMAYNVSVMLSDPEDRWRWVENGIELLRDEGLRYNAGDPHLYVELGWLFQHKIGGITDAANLFYKRKLSEAVGTLFAGPRPDYETPEPGSERVRRMRDELGLLPDVMRALESRFGPLDWRRAETHALYWAYRGRLKAGPEGHWPCDRMMIQALSGLFAGDGARVHPEFLPGIITVYEAALETYPETPVLNAYRRFLRQIIPILYEANETEAAARWFAFFRDRFDPEGVPSDLDTFIRQAEKENRP